MAMSRWLSTLRVLAFAQSLGVLIAVAAVLPSVAHASDSKPAAMPAVADPEYRIGPEDVLEISVWKEDSLKKEVLVRPDGGISFPLAGEVHAAGKTTAELQKEITKRIEQYIPDAVVSVALLKIVGNKIFVIGKVNKPGEYPAGRYVDVLQALAMAGGLTPYAAENDIKVLRKVQGKDAVFPFEYSKVQKGERLEQNITLQGGDVVVVP
jgi:polysaccharide export outer membrane protein